MKMMIAAGLAFAAFSTVPASATVYNALTAFTPASATSGPFTFGSVSGGVFTAFPTGGSCLLTNTVCLTSGNYLGVYKSFDGAAHPGSGTIDVPSDALIFHPGSAGEVATVLFTAPTSGLYSLSLSAFQATNANANSVNIIGYSIGSLDNYTLATLTASQSSFALGNPSFYLTAGDVFGVGVEYNGDYSYDSTGIRFIVSSAVPEPASWLMMIAGFGLVGVSMRRRKAVSA